MVAAKLNFELKIALYYTVTVGIHVQLSVHYEAERSEHIMCDFWIEIARSSHP